MICVILLHEADLDRFHLDHYPHAKEIKLIEEVIVCVIMTSTQNIQRFQNEIESVTEIGRPYFEQIPKYINIFD